MAITPFHPPQRILMGPGPSDVSPRVLEALSRPTIGHLDPLFVSFMDEMKMLLKFAFQTDNELTMPVSAPGSAGMETCFVNLVAGRQGHRVPERRICRAHEGERRTLRRHRGDGSG